MESNQTTDARTSISSGYIFDNAAPETPARFDALSAMYDRTTIQHHENSGVVFGCFCLVVVVVVLFFFFLFFFLLVVFFFWFFLARLGPPIR